MALPGLPPLDGDDSILRRFGWRMRRSQRCQTESCEYLTEPGELFCGDCLRLRFLGMIFGGDEVIENWPRRLDGAETPSAPATPATTPAAPALDRSQPNAAPLLAGPQLDLRCWWCCAILNEDTVKGGVEPGNPAGRERRSPAIEPLIDGYACPAHSDRYHALMATLAQIDRFMNEQHMTSRQVEQVYAYGYLGANLPRREGKDPAA